MNIFITEKHNKKANKVITSLPHCFMRLLYPIFCVDKQTNMITVMKNRELDKMSLAYFF